jgi:hypothetical protein
MNQARFEPVVLVDSRADLEIRVRCRSTHGPTELSSQPQHFNNKTLTGLLTHLFEMATKRAISNVKKLPGSSNLDLHSLYKEFYLISTHISSLFPDIKPAKGEFKTHVDACHAVLTQNMTLSNKIVELHALLSAEVAASKALSLSRENSELAKKIKALVNIT